MTPRSISHFDQSFLWLRKRSRRAVVIASVSLILSLAATAGVWTAYQDTVAATAELTSILPQGALLTIEAKDFAGLLKSWNDSPEKAAWLKSDNYSVFTRSRLYGRLGDAQTEFAQAAGLPPDMTFLNEVAGKESVFAWYDIGKLEFLYVTRMPSGNADKTRLMQMRGKFTTRQVSGETFYVKKIGGTSQGNSPQLNAEPTDADQSGGSSGQDAPSQPRTVAFAVSGDWLLLSTREDLMAGALKLLAANHKAGASDATARESLSPIIAEAWFANAQAAAGKHAGALRMTLNLEKIVRTPYFRSYWIQANVSEIKQYQSAVADLYTDADAFREERVLLPKSAPAESINTTDLASLTALLPTHAGVYRAIASPTVDEALESLHEKLLERGTGTLTDTKTAPNADVAVQSVGNSTDYETRIDTAPLADPVKIVELPGLRTVLSDADLQGMMIISRTGEALDGLWVPFQSAVVFSAGKDWDTAAVQSALQQPLAEHLTASGMGLAWKPVHTATGSYFELSQTRHLELAVRGRICILTDSPALMEEILGTHTAGSGTHKFDGAVRKATRMAGVDFQQERPSFARWSSLVDRTSNSPGEASGNAAPSFFSQDMRGLSDAFSPLESEQMLESRDGTNLHQTVIYAWRH
jgi:hypothetical protein